MCVCVCVCVCVRVCVKTCVYLCQRPYHVFCACSCSSSRRVDTRHHRRHHRRRRRRPHQSLSRLRRNYVSCCLSSWTSSEVGETWCIGERVRCGALERG